MTQRGRILVPETDELKRLREGDWGDFDALNNDIQWCPLHRGNCNDVVPVRRHFDNPKRQDEIFLACQRCVRDLKKAGYLEDSKFARHECYEIVVPRGLSGGRKVALSAQSFEITLDPLQVRYLRALGLKVILAQ